MIRSNFFKTQPQHPDGNFEPEGFVGRTPSIRWDYWAVLRVRQIMIKMVITTGANFAAATTCSVRTTRHFRAFVSFQLPANQSAKPPNITLKR